MAHRRTLTPDERKRPLAMCVDARERMLIEERAASAGLTVSAYMRAAVLGRRLRSHGDFDKIDALTLINEELIGLALVVREGRDALRTLDRIDALQARLASLAGHLA